MVLVHVDILVKKVVQDKALDFLQMGELQTVEILMQQKLQDHF